jgi:hypothetical protein
MVVEFYVDRVGLIATVDTGPEPKEEDFTPHATVAWNWGDEKISLTFARSLLDTETVWVSPKEAVAIYSALSKCIRKGYLRNVDEVVDSAKGSQTPSPEVSTSSPTGDTNESN